jgi:hypothetical protein
MIEQWKKADPDTLTAEEALETDITGREAMEKKLGVEEALEQEHSAEELRNRIREWDTSRQINFLRRVINEGDEQLRDISDKTKLAGVIVRAINLVKANKLHKQKIEALQERVEELQ